MGFAFLILLGALLLHYLNFKKTALFVSVALVVIITITALAGYMYLPLGGEQ